MHPGVYDTYYRFYMSFDRVYSMFQQITLCVHTIIITFFFFFYIVDPFVLLLPERSSVAFDKHMFLLLIIVMIFDRVTSCEKMA